MSICQLGMHKSVQDHTNANVCKQTYDASCTHSMWNVKQLQTGKEKGLTLVSSLAKA